MKEPRFTKGDWKAIFYGHGWKIKPAEIWLGDCSSITPEELEANAHLVESSKDIYKELHYWVEQYGCDCGQLDCKTCEDTIRTIKLLHKVNTFEQK